MTTQAELAERFLSLHHGPALLVMPNPWDLGSAKILEALGFPALATTSGGLAASLGRLDGSVTRDEAVAHAAALVGGVEVPVSADLENGFADDPSGVAATVEMALAAGVAGCSVEDYTRRPADPIYEIGLAAERVGAAAEAAHGGPARLVLTARAENLIHDRVDLDDTIARLQAYQEVGADVLFAPGLRDLGDIRRVLAGIDRPLSVLVGSRTPTISELAEAGVARISVGSAFAWSALSGLVEAAEELRDLGTYGFTKRGAAGWRVAREAFGEG